MVVKKTYNGLTFSPRYPRGRARAQECRSIFTGASRLDHSRQRNRMRRAASFGRASNMQSWRRSGHRGLKGGDLPGCAHALPSAALVRGRSISTRPRTLATQKAGKPIQPSCTSRRGRRRPEPRAGAGAGAAQGGGGAMLLLAYTSRDARACRQSS